MTWELPPDSAAMTQAWNEPSPLVLTDVDATWVVLDEDEDEDEELAGALTAEVTTGAATGASSFGAAGALAGLAGTVSSWPTEISFAYLIVAWLSL